MKSEQQGIAHLGALLVVVVIAAVGFVGYRVMTSGKDKPQSSSQTQTQNQPSNEPVRWAFNTEKHEWFVQSGTAPKCKQPFEFDYTPVDMSQATAVLLPGQYRGFNYKPHGGFGMSSSEVTVKMPMDAKLTGLTRYIEGPDNVIQYVIDFENECGIAFRFDHLHQLAPKFAAIAETRPQAKLNDTRGVPLDKTYDFKAGEVIATAIGHPPIKNFGFDFGVYDYRQRNDISKNTAWRQLHNTTTTNTSQEWYAVCWFDMLPGADADRAKELSHVVINPNRPNKFSDYCPGFDLTLKNNGGQPTDG